MGLYLLRPQTEAAMLADIWSEEASFLAHIQEPGNSSGLAHLSFKTHNILTPVFEILFTKGRKSAEGKGYVNIQRMTVTNAERLGYRPILVS